MSSQPSAGTLLAARGVSKRFSGTQAVNNVTLTLEPGRIQGLIGPNGAGKSTLVGLLTGRLKPDSGIVELRGTPTHLRTPRAAMALGIIPVPQELAVPDPMSVKEFLHLGSEPTTLGLVRRRAERRSATAILERLELAIPIDVAVGSLLPSEQKALVVARALRRRAVALLLDEPTAGMSPDHAEPLLRLLERLRGEHIAVLFISHRLVEVERLCDSVAVMRDGSKVAELAADEAHFDALREHLERGNEDVHQLGHERSTSTSRGAGSAEASCEVTDLTGRRTRGVSFSARTGEVLGLAGLPGSGVEEVFAALAGLPGQRTGTVRVGGRTVSSTQAAVAAGVGYLPPSRSAAILVDETVPRNMTLSALDSVRRLGLVTRRRERRVARPFAEQVGVIPYFDRRMGELSGGNQQRVLFGRLLLTGSQVFVLEGPTVGVDVNARRSLHALIRSLAADGRTCIVGSEEPEELAALCDRILVLRAGRVVDELTETRLTERDVLHAMTGGETPDETRTP
jgi:ribose transport system ATP-binding protein